MYMFNESIQVITEHNGWYIFHCFHIIAHTPINYFQHFLTFVLKKILYHKFLHQFLLPSSSQMTPVSPSSNSLPSFSLSLWKTNRQTKFKKKIDKKNKKKKASLSSHRCIGRQRYNIHCQMWELKFWFWWKGLHYCVKIILGCLCQDLILNFIKSAWHR